MNMIDDILWRGDISASFQNLHQERSYLECLGPWGLDVRIRNAAWQPCEQRTPAINKECEPVIVFWVNIGRQKVQAVVYSPPGTYTISFVDYSQCVTGVLHADWIAR